jgi:hypothetical protein
MGEIDAMNLPDKCPTCGADTPAGDWKRWPVSPGVNLERELALARARIARLEDAGDAMAEWNMSERNLGCDPELLRKWQQAKEAKL